MSNPWQIRLLQRFEEAVIALAVCRAEWAELNPVDVKEVPMKNIHIKGMVLENHIFVPRKKVVKTEDEAKQLYVDEEALSVESVFLYQDVVARGNDCLRYRIPRWDLDEIILEYGLYIPELAAPGDNPQENFDGWKPPKKKA